MLLLFMGTHCSWFYLFSWCLGLDNWTKLFSHNPLKVNGRTANMLIKSWKTVCGKLIWDGRIRYIGNSLPAENVF